MLKLVAQWAKMRKVEVSLIGFDANPHIVDYAKENCEGFENISFEVSDIFSDEFKQRKFDVILCTLFTHHVKEEQLTKIFNQFKSQATIGTVINDLAKARLPSMPFTLAAKELFKGLNSLKNGRVKFM
jgi:2-polyprenyl-3-methyl-5-hydroxy-6-metoxy-1,4-benzoquinol methylase